VDTQDDDDDEQKVEGGSVREAVLTNLWLTALNQLQPTYVRCPEGKPSWLPDCLLDQAGTLLNIWLYFHHGTHA
jgi:hypothetical protein